MTLICGDCLAIMRGLDADSVDLIYLDPPFNKNRTFEDTAGSFDDRFREVDVGADWMESIAVHCPDLHGYLTWTMTRSAFPYLAFMGIRLLECRRLLKATGSIYLHCDPSISHYLKTVMDCIFGEANFRNEIVWCYTSPSSAKRWFPRKHDVILVYSKGKSSWTFNGNAVRVPYRKMMNTNAKEGRKGRSVFSYVTPEVRDALMERGKVPEDWWPEFSPVGRIASERTGYPTQKPVAMLERIIRASSNEGDMVLDPFCGSGTTCVAAKRLNRRWIGIDSSQTAIDVAKARMANDDSAGDRLLL